MKIFRSYKHVFWWPLLIIAGVLAPRFALSADCDQELKTAFQKKSVEMEMAVITGEATELEATSHREKLQQKMRKEKARCDRRLAARASNESGSF